MFFLVHWQLWDVVHQSLYVTHTVKNHYLISPAELMIMLPAMTDLPWEAMDTLQAGEGERTTHWQMWINFKSHGRQIKEKAVFPGMTATIISAITEGDYMEVGKVDKIPIYVNNSLPGTTELTDLVLPISSEGWEQESANPRKYSANSAFLSHSSFAELCFCIANISPIL